MSFEAVSLITEAESAAKALVAEAETRAKQMISDAENDGRAAVTAAGEKAERELTELKKQVGSKAVAEAGRLSESTENSKAELRARAEKQIDRAADLVVERIVNG